MKKKNILGLGLGLLMLTSPINPIEKNYKNIAFAGDMTTSEENTYDSIISEIEDFKKSEIYKNLNEKVKKDFDDLIGNLNEENFTQESYNKISEKISEIKLAEYKKLYKEIKTMIKGNLSDKLKNNFNEIKESYDSVQEYNQNYNNLNILKDKINAYNKELALDRNILKEGIEKNKNLDLADEKKVLDNEDSNLDSVNEAIKSINKKVDDFNEKVRKKAKEEKEKLAKEIEDAIKNHEEVKKDIVYKKSSKEAKDKLEKAFNELKNSQIALKEGKEEDFGKIIDKYNELVNNLDGKIFIDELNALIKYFNENQDKIKDEEKKAKLSKELNSVVDDDQFDSEKLKDLEKRIKDAVNEKPGYLEQETPKRVTVSRSKNPVVKKSRSFVRTGIGSIAKVAGVLVLAAGGYLYLKKKK
ncbi:hypothetical protein FYJ26_07860 [Anaerococcus sp. WCA-380-WT-2B]|uniref:Uncharacterized protein n=1 Tax=Anaerococcus porci TaxID=2652269 RepID=A0A6N7VWB3_9FIRM|nr:hypothetical protein [Anaerococcus porci]MSS78314.1 hypothetical protein [Anaerococcus porci]